MFMYNPEGKQVSVEKLQVEILENAGWTHKAPEQVEEQSEEEPTKEQKAAKKAAERKAAKEAKEAAEAEKKK